MMDPKMCKAINEQVNAELYSSYLYLSMAAYFHSKDLPGFANWVTVQAQEELVHAMKFFGHVVDRGARAEVDAIEKPPADWKSPEAAFRNVLEHEEKVTARIHALVDLALKLKDHATNNVLQWFVTEQIEEEANAAKVLQSLRLAGQGSGLFLLDRELAARTFVMPPAGAGPAAGKGAAGA
jgi:ferritin